MFVKILNINATILLLPIEQKFYLNLKNISLKFNFTGVYLKGTLKLEFYKLNYIRHSLY